MSITINDADAQTYEKITEITVLVRNVIVYQVVFNGEKKFSDLPFHCFTENNVSLIKELNFNNLKKCDAKEKFKYIVVFLGDFENVSETHNGVLKNFNTWHNASPSVKIKFNDKTFKSKEFTGKMEKIFYKGFSPEINKK